MLAWLLQIELINSPIGIVLAGVSAVGFLIAVAVGARRRILLTALCAGAGGAVAGWIATKIVDDTRVFELPLPSTLYQHIPVIAGGVFASLALVVFAPWWRRGIAAVTAIIMVMAGIVSVNAVFGVTHTPAAILGIQTSSVQPLPSVAPDAIADEGVDPAVLYANWHPPADMPATGRVSALDGPQAIPATGFTARPGALYLPPAALVAHPPKLPVIVFTMGEPGSPDPLPISRALDAFAAAHQGLAPITLIVDQLGSTWSDPGCQDSATFGKVSTYLNHDVPAWISAHLNVVTDHRYWIIGGYSNGGACAAVWGAQFPQIWGGLWSVSGSEFAGDGDRAKVLQKVFGGDVAAFTAAQPANIMAKAAPGTYQGHIAVFSWGAQDRVYGPGQSRNLDAAKKAGFTAIGLPLSGTGHVGLALDEGLAEGLKALGSFLGLAAP